MVRFEVESTSPLVSSVEISSVSGKELSGRCDFKLSGFAPVTPVSVTGGSPKVTLRSFDGECPLEEGVYYIALIPGEYPAGDLQIKFNYTNGSSNTGALAFSGKIAVGEAFDYGTLAPTEESGSGTIDTTPKPQIEDKYDIYLLIGQSNMAGRGYLTDADSSTYTVSFPDTSSFLLYCQDMKAKSNFHSDVEIQAGDRIVTLSTCAYDWYDARYVVQGKLVPLGVVNPAESVITAYQGGN